MGYCVEPSFNNPVDTTDHIVVCKILQGVKNRVESQIEPVRVADVEFIIFVLAFFIFVAAFIALLVRSLTWTGWLTTCGVGIGWLVVWYAPIWF